VDGADEVPHPLKLGGLGDEEFGVGCGARRRTVIHRMAQANRVEPEGLSTPLRQIENYAAA